MDSPSANGQIVLRRAQHQGTLAASLYASPLNDTNQNHHDCDD
jgi:hypothetical protein